MLLVALCSFSRPVAAQNEEEYRLKAAFILNFLKFTIFPARTERSIYLVCVDGGGYALEAVRGIDGQLAGQRQVSVARSADLDAKRCDVRFFAASEGGSVRSIAAALEAKSLVIVEGEKSCSGPWHINLFFDAENRLRFEINQENAKGIGIAFSSKLLSLAKICGSPG